MSITERLAGGPIVSARQNVTAWATNFGRSVITSAASTFVTAGVQPGDLVTLGGVNEVSTVTSKAASGIPQSSYFDLYTAYDTISYYVWMNKSSGGTDPLVAGKIGIEATFTTGASANTVATALRTAINNAGVAGLIASGAGTTVTITHYGIGTVTNIVDTGGTTMTMVTTTAGTGASANDGAYVVNRVISETEVELTSTIPNAAAGVAGAIEINQGRHVIDCLDETTLTPATLATNCPNIISRTSVPTLTGWNRTRAWARIMRIAATSAISPVFTVTQELFSCEGRADMLFRISNQDPLTLFSLIIGTIGSDDVGATESGILLGANFNSPTLSKYSVKMYGSSIYCGVALNFGLDGEAVSSFFYGPSMQLPNNTAAGGKISNVNVLSKASFGYIASAAPDVFENFTFVDTGASSVFLSATAVVGGLLLSADATTPTFQALGATIEVRNPRADYDVNTLFQFFSVAATWIGTKTYTFNPRFVLRQPDLFAARPIAGLTVRVFEIYEERYVGVYGNDDGAYTVTINGIAFTYNAVGASVSTIISNLISLINAGSEPVTASTVNYFVTATDTLVLRPDNGDIPFTVELSSPNGNLSMEDFQFEVSGSPFTTDSNGRISGGDGILFPRGKASTSGQYVTVKTRVRVSGADTQRTDAILNIVAPMNFDFPVSLATPDFEGEISQ